MKFLDVFKALIPSTDFNAAQIENVVMNRVESVLSADIVLPFFIPEDRQLAFSKEVSSVYNIKTINFNFVMPIQEVVVTTDTKSESKQADKPKSDLIYGKHLPSKDKVEQIKNIDEYYGSVVIEGKVLDTDSHETKTGKIIFKFDITDGTSSISVKMFLDPKKNNLEPIQRIKKGIGVRVLGNPKYDTYDRETVFMATAISEIALPEKQDNAEKKRVELHLHTKMSMMDSVIEADEAVKQAAKWGHKAIAITDHGVVQAFPDAYDAGNKYKIKIIYGTECYLIDDSIKIVDGECNEPLNGTFVAFDIETTGLSPLNAEIIEIGAVKIQNGNVVDTFDALINPGFSISEFTTNLTGISNEMLEGKPDLDTVLPEFLEFIGDAPLIAHNAPFDTGFISYACLKRNLKFENPSIDTLVLSRCVDVSQKKHTLDAVAGRYDIDMGSHHRADDDANTCAKIFLSLISKVQETQYIKTVNELNEKVAKFDFTKQKTYHAILLVKNQTGMKNLYRIISESHINYFHKRPRVPRSLLERNREGIIVGSACEAGELYRSIIEGKSFDELKKVAEFYDYLEIQPLGNNRFMLENGMASSVDQLIENNKTIINLAKELNKPYVATCDAHFLKEEDSIFRSVIQAGQGYNDADNQAPLYFRTTDEMLDEFYYLDDETKENAVINNPNLIANMVEDDLHPIPKQTYAPSIEGAEQDVRNISEARAKEIYGENLPDIVKERMEKELHSIIDNGFSVMYVIAQKLVWDSLDHGYLVGSRGSVGSSFVAFLMKITEVNALIPHYICPDCKNVEWMEGEVGCGMDLPDKKCPVCGAMYNKDGHDIPFETFLGFYGDKDPDIDLNFSGEYQSEAHKYTERIFGHDHVFKAGTISGLAEKTAYGYVLKYLEERNLNVSNAEKNRLKKGCEGVRKTTGQHPGGMVVVPADMDILDFCPINRPADKKDADFITTHFDYGKMKGTLLKFDILGHDDPTALKMLSDLTGVDVTKIPLDDKKVMSLFTSVDELHYLPEFTGEDSDLDTVGTYAIPEFGTNFVRQMLHDTKPTTFNELVRISGLSHGTDVWLNNAQDLVKNGTATLKDVICTRDDIMTTLIRWGVENKKAFDIMEFTRKGKLKQHMDMIPFMEEANVPKWYIDSCLKIQYMFPKAHAAAYVTMAFRIAWFKVYYPEAFYQAYFTVRADVFDASIMTKGVELVREHIKAMRNSENKLTGKEMNTLTILEVCNEMYSRGYKFVPIDLYKSDAKKFLKTDDGILPPLNALPGLGESAAIAIVEARQKGEFLTVDDLRIRSGINKTSIEVLRNEGCLNGIPESSQLTFF